jgi:chromosomal replication initiation ATPase DnaA
MRMAAVRANPPVLAFAESVARKYGLEVQVLLGRRNTKTVRLARREFMAVTLETLDLSTTEAGALFDRDHSTICHAVKQYRKERV